MDRARLGLLVMWLVVLSAYGYIHQRSWSNPMAISRLDLLHAIAAHGTFAIDAYEGNTPDKAVVEGHYYCDKAPGTALLALPGFYLSSRILAAAGVPLDSPVGWFASSWLCVASLAIVTSFGSVCLFLWLKGFVDDRSALLSTLVFAFGSMTFPYSTMLMSHGLVAGLLTIALWCLRFGHDEPAIALAHRRGLRICMDFAGGCSCSLAIACEYDAALVAGGILVATFYSERRRGVRMIAGAIPALLTIPAYDWVCTGNPFSLPYTHEAVFTQMHDGFFGIHEPNSSKAFDLLLGPQQGLFFWTPFLLLAFIGYPLLFRRHRALFWICYCVPFLQVVTISGYFLTAGGFTLGPRFLAPILPLLILPAALAATRLPFAALILGAWSCGAMGGATLVDARFPGGLKNPLFEFYLPRLVAGNFTHNLGQLAGLEKHLSLLPIFLALAAGCWYLWRKAGNTKVSNAFRGG